MCAAWVMHVVVEVLWMFLQQGIGIDACHQLDRLCAGGGRRANQSAMAVRGGSGAHACRISIGSSGGVWCQKCGGWAVPRTP